MKFSLIFSVVLAQYCTFKVLGDPNQGYDGYCWDLAVSAKIDVAKLNALNNFDCATQGKAGQRLCVTAGSLPPIPDPPSKSDGSCNFVEVVPNVTCQSISTEKKISIEQIIKFNKARGITCSDKDFLQPGARICVSLGTYPSRAPVQNNPNAPCVLQKTDPVKYYSCQTIAAAYDITAAQIDQWNQKTWQFKGCAAGLIADQNICVSQGTPAPPPLLPLDKVQCGAQHPDPSKRECPLKACCSKFGWCGTDPSFCDKVDGAPGLGCQSNCELGVPASSKKCDANRMSKAVGYYESWAPGRGSSCNPLEPEDIDVTKWTHIHYSFAIVTEDSRLDMADENERARLRKFRLLKAKKQSLKLIISVGGWTFNNAGTSQRFTNMVSSQASRQRFIQSVISFLNTYGLDGFDMDWEYPTAEDRGGRPQDAENYLSLMREFRATPAFGSFSLSIAAPASYWYLRGFKIAEMSDYLDYIVYMTYDIHGNWDYHNKWTNGKKLLTHNNWEEVEGALTMIQRAGVPSNKILLGLGYYGRSFLLADKNCNTMRECDYQDPGPLIPAIDNYSNLATPGRCTKSGGILGLFEIKEIIQNQNLKPTYDERAVSKILIYNNGAEWIGYDDEETIAIKVKRANDMCLGGIIVWALDLDTGTVATTLDGINALDGSPSPYLSWNDALLKFNAKMGSAYNLDNGLFKDSFFDSIADSIGSLFNENYLEEDIPHRLMLAAFTNALKTSQQYIVNKMNLRISGSAEDLNNRLLAYQTQGDGRSFFTCFQESTIVQCPRPLGTWRNKKMILIDENSMNVRWQLNDEHGLESALKQTFNLDWNLLNQEDVSLEYVFLDNCDWDIDRPRRLFCAPRKPKTYKYSGLYVFSSNLAKNVFSQDSVKIYDEYVLSEIKTKIATFMKKNIGLFNCDGACLTDENLNLTPKVSKDEIFSKAAEEIGIPAEFWEFGTVRLPKYDCFDIPDSPRQRCRMMPIFWKGGISLKKGYPPNMETEINTFIKDQSEIIHEMELYYSSDDITADEIALQIQAAIFSLGSTQDFVENIVTYENAVTTLINEKDERGKAIVGFVVTMVLTEIALAVVTAGVGAVVAGAASAIANSARYAALASKVGNIGSKLSSYVKSANILQKSKGIRQIAAEFRQLFKSSSKATAKVGTNSQKSISRTTQLTCQTEPLIDAGLDFMISGSLAARSYDDFYFENNGTHLEKRAKVQTPKKGGKKPPCPQMGDYIYRIIRADENCVDGLSPKDWDANKDPKAHIKCGSRAGFVSQFISTSTDLATSVKNRQRFTPEGENTPKIVRIPVSELSGNNVQYWDLTQPAAVAKLFPKRTDPNRNFVKSSCEVVLQPNKGKPIKCEEIAENFLASFLKN